MVHHIAGNAPGVLPVAGQGRRGYFVIPTCVSSQEYSNAVS